MRRVFHILAIVMMAAQAYALDCSHKPPCPPGTTAQESVSCDACCPDGSFITSAEDKFCCPEGYIPSPDNTNCIPKGAFIKSDGTCYVMNETDACCLAGWHTVNQYECCPDGFTLATDNEFCCTQRADGKCCAPNFRLNVLTGRCIPPKPTGVMLR